MEKEISIEETIDDIEELEFLLKYLIYDKDKKKKYKKKLSKLSSKLNNPDKLEDIINE